MIAQAVLWGIPTPAFSTALAFFDGYRSEVVPANLIQAQVLLIFILIGIIPVSNGDDSVITSAHIPSVFFQAKRMTSSRLARISVRITFITSFIPSSYTGIDVNWTGRGGNVSSTSYLA